MVRHVFFALLFAAVASLAASAHAQESARLNELLERLKAERYAEDAEPLEKEIIDLLGDGPTDTVDYLLVRFEEAEKNEDWERAVGFADRIIGLAPEHHVGWASRARALVAQNEYADAAGDLARTLAREPRHFPAMVALGRIFLADGDAGRAYEILTRALEINPHMEQVQGLVKQIRFDALGRPA